MSDNINLDKENRQDDGVKQNDPGNVENLGWGYGMAEHNFSAIFASKWFMPLLVAVLLFIVYDKFLAYPDDEPTPDKAVEKLENDSDIVAKGQLDDARSLKEAAGKKSESKENLK